MPSSRKLAELRRQAVALAEAQSALTKCCAVLGDWEVNAMNARLDSKLREVLDKIEIAEGR